MSEGDLPEPPLSPPPPAPPQPPEAKREQPSTGRSLLYGCLSVVFAVPFAILNILFFVPFGPVGGTICAILLVVGMFLVRRENKKPIIGALAVGAAIAFVLQGTCLLIIAKSA